MKKTEKIIPPRCPYCGRPSILRKASYVYKNGSDSEYLYVCAGYPECDSYVGAHKKNLKPKGALADRELRNKRILAHKLFDAIWKNHILSRTQAYKWMQDIFGMTKQEAHIACLSDYRLTCLMQECKKVLHNHSIAC